MDLQGKRIGFALTGSHCTIDKVLPQMAKLVEAGALVFPLISESVQATKSRYGEPQTIIDEITRITKQAPWHDFVSVEPIGPQATLDAMVVMPCTGNTIAKIALGVSDSVVSFACKAHLRNGKPLILAIASNDALSTNAVNLGILLNRKNLFFVPFGQDNPEGKSNSLIAHYDLLSETIYAALQGRQIQPLIRTWK